MRVTPVVVIASLLAATTSLAQPPHIGTWDIDYANSDGGEQVWTFADLGSGLWEFRVGGRRIFHFRMDLEPCATCETSFYTWELIGPETYLTSFVGPWARDVVKIAPDGDSLSFIQKRPGSGNQLEDHSGSFRRSSGGPGLAGTWRSELERSVSPASIQLGSGVGEWFVFKWTSHAELAQEWVCVLLLDGADHPCFHALAQGWTISMRQIDDRTLAAELKVNRDLHEASVYTVSADGRTMTRTQRSSTGAVIKTVYVNRAHARSAVARSANPDVDRASCALACRADHATHPRSNVVPPESAR
jgi:hypothetical protein